MPTVRVRLRLRRALMSRFAAWRWSLITVTVASLTLALFGLGAAPAQAIVNGTLDTEHLSVGSLVQHDSEGHLQARCSGFLASATVFVTAHHCFLFFGIADGAAADVTFARSITDTSAVVHGVARWNTTTGPSNDAHDVGVIELTAAVTDRSPMTLPALDELVTFQKSGALEAHDLVRLVGSGAVHVERPRQFTFANEVRSTTVEFQTLQPGFMVMQQKGGGACFGDSGGPNIVTVDGREIVASITRHLNAGFDCETGLWGYRLDTVAARAFLGQYMALP
jgi:Trypsin